VTETVVSTPVATVEEPTGPDCSNYTISNDRLVAARIYYEGASTFYKGAGEEKSISQRLFIKMIYAVKSLHDAQAPGSDYSVFTQYNNPAGRQLLSIANPDCSANPGHCELGSAETFNGSHLDAALPDFAVEITNQVLSDPPCPYAEENPFKDTPSDYAEGIHWLSPTQFPRLDMPPTISIPNVDGCTDGCQVNDIRERSHFIEASDNLQNLSQEEEQLIPFRWEYAASINAPIDTAGNTDCYWRAVYYFSESNFTFAMTRTQQYPEHKDYYDGKFLCPPPG
jgi:hypothetical protein